MELNNEQIESIQEKIKNMSPEELKEFQKKNCIFCQIIAGNVASKKVYEDDKVVAILDINPANPGHLLLMPKEHYAIMPLIPENELEHLAMVVKALSLSLLRAFKVDGTTVFIANGTAAGQKAQHFMIHVIPRKENDNIGLFIPENSMSEQDLSLVQEKLVKKVNEIFGIKGQGKGKESNKKAKIVEAEFEEQENQKEKTKDKRSKEKEEINLDDISRLLLGK